MRSPLREPHLSPLRLPAPLPGEPAGSTRPEPPGPVSKVSPVSSAPIVLHSNCPPLPCLPKWAAFDTAGPIFPEMEWMSRKRIISRVVLTAQAKLWERPAGERRWQRLDLRRQGSRCSANGRRLNQRCVQCEAGSISFLLFPTSSCELSPGAPHQGAWQLRRQRPRRWGPDQGKSTKQVARQLPVLGVHLVLGPSSELTHNHPTCAPGHLFPILHRRTVPGPTPGQLGSRAGAPLLPFSATKFRCESGSWVRGRRLLAQMMEASAWRWVGRVR